MQTLITNSMQQGTPIKIVELFGKKYCIERKITIDNETLKNKVIHFVYLVALLFEDQYSAFHSLILQSQRILLLAFYQL